MFSFVTIHASDGRTDGRTDRRTDRQNCDSNTVRCITCGRRVKLVELHTLTYTERLELLGLERLESMRIRADVLFAYKLLFGLIALHSNDFFILRESTCTRGHPY